jgi:hypothetical protein
MKLKNNRARLFLMVMVPIVLGNAAKAQDNTRGSSEPIINSINPSKLAYDILVDGNLAQDDPGNRKFKTLQAAYAAAPAGTERKPTVIGIAPNVYRLSSAAPRTPSMSITKNYITFLGLTNNRRSVVLADNRGLMQGADDNGYILVVNATGFSAKNLTILNYCNVDYEYPGDPGKNLKKRSDTTTQAVALQASGDKHLYENIALLSRLDTMFLQTTRSYFKNVYIEGTDDWMGGGQISVWEDCTLVYPAGSGVMSAANVVFINCRFEATKGMQFYKAEYRGAEMPNALINCILPATSAQAPVAWVRGKALPRPGALSLTYHNKDADGNPAVIYDSNVGAPAFTYSRELSGNEVEAFNPWNLLRAAPNGTVDNWDPAAVRDKYEKIGAGDLVYRVTLKGSSATVQTGGPSVTIAATVLPQRASGTTITWSAKSDLVLLSQTTGPAIIVTARNLTEQPQWVPITAAAPNGFYAVAYVYAEPKHVAPPAITSAPSIRVLHNGTAVVSYALDLGGREDQSLVSWSICDEAACLKSREVAVTRGNQPLRTLPLMPGFAGKFLKTAVQPKHQFSDAGPAVSAISPAPVAASDITTPDILVNFRNLVTTPDGTYVSGLWTILGPWSAVAGDELVNGYGVRSGSGTASLLYQEDGARGNMKIDLVMTPEKTAGQGFSIPGSPAETGQRNLHADVYIKYDARTKNGYALRFWRTTQSASKCMFQLYKIVDGVGSPVDETQVLSGVFKPNTKMTIKVIGNKLSVDAANSADVETLHLEGTITPNRFGGAGVFWPGGSANVYSSMDISYMEKNP